ncbi:MAG: type II secretion system secretin GspD [Gammaproteobacteria bacterium]|nr:type II secretion system secretin GspD [Gammaproteobacteria bacterium]
MDLRPHMEQPSPGRPCGTCPENDRSSGRALAAAFATALMFLAATAVAAQDTGEEPETWVINSPSVDMVQFITQVSQITGKTFVIDPRIKGTVSVVSQAALDRDGVYDLLLSVLRVHNLGAVAVGDGDVVHIVQNVTTVKQSGGVVGEAPEVPSQEIVTQLIPVQNVQAAELVKILRPMSPQHGHVGAVADRNVIILSDHANNVERLKQVIRELDVLNDDEVTVRALQHAWASSVVEILEKVAPEQMAKGAVGPQSIRIIGNERNNSLLLRGKPQPLAVVNDLIDKLDVPATAMSNTQVIYLSYADAETLAETLNQLVGGRSSENADSPIETTIQADTGLNAIVARTNPRTMNEILNIVKQLDTRRAQVLIEAAIAEISVSDLFSVGAETAGADERGRSVPAFNATLNGIIGALLGDGSTDTVTPVDALSRAESPTLSIVKLDREGVTFGVVLNALSTNTAADLLSAPSVLTLDNQEARIHAGQEVPFRTGSFTTVGEGTTNPFTTVQRSLVGITLEVTPHVHEGTAVRLEIKQTVSNILDSGLALNAADLITQQREIETTVLAEGGETIVLGGLIQNDYRDTAKKVPVLGDIPLVGRLFRSTSQTRNKRHLLVFIRPTVVRSREDANRVTARMYDYIWEVQIYSRSPTASPDSLFEGQPGD